LATVQEVLQADWQEAWHLPQPPVFTVDLRFLLVMVVICFKVCHLALIFVYNI
jgi:hypothetical protein